ncbi:MAG: relaxase/mobilization nuclease domain-containing protein [Pseudomonadota bacterium]
MILVGSQRGGAADLAAHLEKPENEHVEVHELRGFVSDTLKGALNEAYAVSRGTRCKRFLYSLSLNPPQDKAVPIAAFEAAIERVERQLGLTGQPRAIVFHEKKGRRHAHCVWSRIKGDEMKAVHLPFDHEKLMAVSRELFLHHGWDLPRGLVNRQNRDPRNFTLAEWQQARRSGRHPTAIRTELQEAWAVSDTRESFDSALRERGFRLAQGRRQRFVVVDWHGEAHSLPRRLGLKTKEVRARLGDPSALPDVETVQEVVLEEKHHTVLRLKDELDQQQVEAQRTFEARRLALVERQKAERLALSTKQMARQAEQAVIRQSRFRTGMAGLWDRLNGTHKRIQAVNEREAEAVARRDRAEKDALIARHVSQRRRLTIFQSELRRDYGRHRQQLERAGQLFGPSSRKRSGPELG